MADVIYTDDKTKTLSGEFLNFYTPRSQKIRSLKVYFSPKQAGSGTPSPENVRPISGWTGVEIGHCGKNLIDTSKNSCSHPSNGYKASVEPTDMIFRNGELSGTVETGWRDTCVFSQNVPFQPGTYRLSFDYINGIRNYNWRPICVTKTYTGWYTAYKVINAAANDSGHITTTFTADEPFYISMCLNSFGNSTVTAVNKIYNLQLELGTKATEYTPYKTNLSLPKEYQEVEYLESTGTQYINTNVIPYNLNFEIFVDYVWVPLDVYTWVSPFGARLNTSNNRADYVFRYGEGFYGKGYQSVRSLTNIKNDKNRNLVSLSRNSALRNGVNDASSEFNNTYAINYDVYLFSTNNSCSAVNNFVGRIYSAYIKLEDNYAFYGVPCYRKSDKVAGMYDTVTGQFYTNSGTGEFITGPAVNRYDIDWTEDVGTVYGGYVDLISGELVEKIASIDLANYPFAQYNKTNHCWGKGFLNSMKPGNRVGNDLLCDSYKALTPKSILSSGENLAIWAYNTTQPRLIIRNDAYIKEDDTYDIDGLNESLNGVIVTYPLATPITHQLSPATLSTLTRDNNFWSNADRIEIEYDYIGVFNPIESRKNIFTATPHTATAKDNVVSFGADMAADLKECKVYFTPVQEGTGDPSLDNVRPITGWDGISITKCGKNLAANGIYCGRLKFTNNVYADSVYYCYYFPIPKAPIYITKSSTSIPLISVSMEPPARNVPVISSGIPTMTNVRRYIFDNTEIGAKYMCIHGSNNSAFADLKVLLDNAELMITTDGYSDTYETSENDLVEITIPFPQTIYGGYVDLVNGEVVETWKQMTIDENSTVGIFPWHGIQTDSATGTEYVTALFRRTDNYPKGNNSASNLCDKLPYSTSYNKINHAYFYDGDSYGPAISLPTNLIGTTNETLKQYLSGNSFVFCYQLRTPIHHAIDTQTLTTLRGANTIWSDSNSDVEITYWKHNDDAYQHVPSSPITSNDNFIIVTDDGYAIGEEDDFIVY
jgi:hypothetical protein